MPLALIVNTGWGYPFNYPVVRLGCIAYGVL